MFALVYFNLFTHVSIYDDIWENL